MVHKGCYVALILKIVTPIWMLAATASCLTRDGRFIVPLPLAFDIVPVEYWSNSTNKPCDDPYKYVYCETDPGMLFDLEADPGETRNLCEEPEHSDVAAEMLGEILSRWDPTALKTQILESQRRRRFIQQVLLEGERSPWDYRPGHRPLEAVRAQQHQHLDDVDEGVGSVSVHGAGGAGFSAGGLRWLTRFEFVWRSSTAAICDSRRLALACASAMPLDRVPMEQSVVQERTPDCFAVALGHPGAPHLVRH